MNTGKPSKLTALERIADDVPEKHHGTIQHIPQHFLADLRVHLGLTDAEIGTLFGCSRTNILRKRNTEPKAAPAAPPPALVASIPTDEQPGPQDATDLSMQDFLSRKDLTPSEEVEFLQQHGRNMLSTYPATSQARITLFKLLTEQAQARLESDVADGKQLVVALMRDLVQSAGEARERIGIEIIKAIRLAVDKFIVRVEDKRADLEGEKKELIRQIDLFDSGEVLREVLLIKPSVAKGLDRYMAREVVRPSLVGGGIVKAENSKQGGQNYRSAERRERGEREARGL